MLIGKDFEKVEFDLFGFHLVEPNALIGDTFLFLVSLFLAYRVIRLSTDSYRNNQFSFTWKWFFIIFGVSFMAGGLGHSFYNYWGLEGKYTAWYLGFFATFLIEWAMLSIHPKAEFVKMFQRISIVKLLLAITAETIILSLIDIHDDPSKGLMIPLVNSTIGLLFALGYLARVYEKTHATSFKYFWMSVLILIPTTIFQVFKINFHPLFDRSDASHVFLFFSLILYYQAVRGYLLKVKSEVVGGGR
ncbi:MAG: hypothetical protein IPM74_05770 [Crocinitomicaceae bacterium]|nr:hypothetical protein [Crocinitomicaceae bacterium]MBK8925412.1 hypothetical protein [Crocinitomicaceae bacterium]